MSNQRNITKRLTYQAHPSKVPPYLRNGPLMQAERSKHGAVLAVRGKLRGLVERACFEPPLLQGVHARRQRLENGHVHGRPLIF